MARLTVKSVRAATQQSEDKLAAVGCKCILRQICAFELELGHQAGSIGHRAAHTQSLDEPSHEASPDRLTGGIFWPWSAILQA